MPSTDPQIQAVVKAELTASQQREKLEKERQKKIVASGAANRAPEDNEEEAGEELTPGTRVQFSNQGGAETLEGEVIPYSSDLEDLDTGGSVSDYHQEGGILIRANDGEIYHRQVDDVKVLPSTHEASEEKAMTQNESTQITNFIKAVSQKNYASANKYLQGVVEGKLKRTISKAVNK